MSKKCWRHRDSNPRPADLTFIAGRWRQNGHLAYAAGNSSIRFSFDCYSEDSRVLIGLGKRRSHEWRSENFQQHFKSRL